jgi:hypothetical protein
MKFTPWFLAALAPFGAIAYNGYLGHALVVVLTVGIFLGTLSLGKTVAQSSAAPGPSLAPVAESLPPAQDHTSG